MKTVTFAVASLIPLLALVTSCKEKGPAEESGEQIDKVIEDVKDAVDPKGPMEKAGEKVDKVFGE